MSAGRELAVLGRDGEQLGAREPLRRSAFVDVHVRRLGADHRLVRAREGVDRGDVRAAAVEDEERPCPVAEMAAEQRLGAPGPRVGAV